MQIAINEAMQRLSSNKDELLKVFKCLNKEESIMLEKVKDQMRPSLGESHKKDSLRGLKLICCWLCTLKEIHAELQR
jgi:hypothetical protein